MPHCVGPDGRTFDLNTFQVVEGVEPQDRGAYIVDGLLQPPKGVGRRYLEDLNEQSLVRVRFRVRATWRWEPPPRFLSPIRNESAMPRRLHHPGAPT